MDLAALEARAAAEEAVARAGGLTEEEQKVASTLARIAKAKEERAFAEKTRRGFALSEHEEEARKAVAKGVLVKGIDLVDTFPLGEAPPAAMMPGNGLLVVRDPPQGLGGFHREYEHKKIDLWEVFANLVCQPGTVLFPDVEKDTTEGIKLRAFFERYNGVAVAVGEIVARLGGSKAAQDKRGRA